MINFTPGNVQKHYDDACKTECWLNEAQTVNKVQFWSQTLKCAAVLRRWVHSRDQVGGCGVDVSLSARPQRWIILKKTVWVGRRWRWISEPHRCLQRDKHISLHHERSSFKLLINVTYKRQIKMSSDCWKLNKRSGGHLAADVTFAELLKQCGLFTVSVQERQHSKNTNQLQMKSKWRTKCFYCIIKYFCQSPGKGEETMRNFLDCV